MSSKDFICGRAVELATVLFWATLAWVLFLIFNYRKHTTKPSLLVSIQLFGHMWLACLLLGTSKIAIDHNDPFLVWFWFVVGFAWMFKNLVNIFFYLRYKPAKAPPGFHLSSKDVTAIVPTVGPAGNAIFPEMAASILYNDPKKFIFSTITEEAKKKVQDLLVDVRNDLENGTSTYQKERGLPAKKITAVCLVVVANVANKREQFIHATDEVDTPIIVSADDTAVWHPELLSASLPAFAEDKVGLVGTHKEVKRLDRPTHNPSSSWFTNAWNSYCFGFWNAIGGTYLMRHNFEACATITADGGVFTISGRTFLVRSSIVQDKKFKNAFLSEYILTWLALWNEYILAWLPKKFKNAFLEYILTLIPRGGFGPINADDDVFLTRWVELLGMKVAFQSSKEATMTTVLGKDGGRRFKDQCLRWSRTTMRQNPQILFIDLLTWWQHPLTVWTTYLPWLYNAALIWDTLAIILFYNTEFYQQSSHRSALMAGLVAVIWMKKLIKIAPWFLKYPQDFFLYFFPIPAWAFFIYGHSILKIYTAFTFWDLSWTGRKLPTVNKTKQK